MLYQGRFTKTALISQPEILAPRSIRPLSAKSSSFLNESAGIQKGMSRIQENTAVAFAIPKALPEPHQYGNPSH